MEAHFYFMEAHSYTPPPKKKTSPERLSRLFGAKVSLKSAGQKIPHIHTTCIHTLPSVMGHRKSAALLKNHQFMGPKRIFFTVPNILITVNWISETSEFVGEEMLSYCQCYK